MATSDWIGEAGRRYLRCVASAAFDPSAFADFRNNPDYTYVLEHLTEEQGAAYLSMISDRLVREICLESEWADTIGRPAVYRYGGALLSPTTLRYGKVLNDIVRYFPTFGQMSSIVEIGPGYGGQARLISELAARENFKISTYTLLDRLPVLMLCREYLEHFVMYPQLKCWTRAEIPIASTWDFAISNFAFSELSKPIQEDYIRRVLQNAHSGYLTMNTGLCSAASQWQDDHITLDELTALLPNVRILSEEPKTAAQNYIMLFGDHV